jgi:hypothetical protein
VSHATQTNHSKQSHLMRNWIIFGSLLLLAGTVLAWQLKPAKPLPLDADVVSMAKWMSSVDYQDLPEIDKRAYRNVMRKNTKDLVAALNNGKLTRPEYDEAYLNAWLARQMDRMHDYFRLPVADRKYVWAQEYAKKHAAKAAQGPSTDPQPSEELEKAFVDRVVRTWPAEERQEWEEFRRANKLAKGKTVAKK